MTGRFRREAAVALALVLLLLLVRLLAPEFYAGGNLRNLAVDNAPLLVAAAGATLVILVGGIDVSIGSQFAVCGVIAGHAAKLGLPLPAVVAGTLAAGAAMGALNGLLVARGRIPAILATLATMVAFRGALRAVTGGEWVQDLPAAFQWLGLAQQEGQALFLATGAFSLAALAAFLRWTHPGRAVLATGSGAEAARLAGIRPERVVFWTFVLSGGLTGLAALLSFPRYRAIEIEAGLGLELAAIACAVVGGASVAGGRGTMIGTALGVALLGTLGTMLVFLRADPAWERAIQGAILLAAVTLDRATARRRTGARTHGERDDSALLAGRLPAEVRALALILAVEVAAFSLHAERFLSWENALEVVRACAELGLIALAATAVMKTGGVDLSAGSVLGLCAVAMGALGAGSQAALGAWPAALAAVLIGGACGLFNGALVAWAGVPPLIVTLATMALFRGLAEGFSGGYAVWSDFPASFLALGQGYLLGVLPPQLPLLALVGVLAYLALHRAPFGRRIAAIGFSEEGARYGAVPVRRSLLTAYALSGLAAGLAGVLYVSHLGQAKADAGTGFELSAVTIALLGGTRVHGGVGSVAGTLLALAAVAVLQNGLRLAGMESEIASILLGVLLIGAVLLQRSARARAPGGGASGAALSSELDMKNSQVAAIVVAILLGAVILALSNHWMVRSLLASGARSTVAVPPARAAVTIAMMPKSKSDPYFVSCRKGAEEAARELGVELLWDGPTETDAALQNEVVEGWITRGVDVIAASVENKEAISTVLRKARSRGIKVLTWDADASADAREFLVNQATPEGIGRALADEAARILGGEGSFAIITASLTAANQNEWIAHIRARLAEKHPGLSIAVIRPSDGMRDKALVETKNVLRAYPDVKLIVAIAAPAVPGAAEAVVQEGSAVKVIGLSVPSLCRDYVHAGVIESIVLWNTLDLGYLTVHSAALLASGELRSGVPRIRAGKLGEIEVRGDQVLLGEPFRFDRTNIDRFEF